MDAKGGIIDLTDVSLDDLLNVVENDHFQQALLRLADTEAAAASGFTSSL